MRRRPSVRAVLATSAAAALLVGGADLASYAATDHGHDTGAGATKAATPKTLVYHIGKPGKKFNGTVTVLSSAKVAAGTYEIGMSGDITETNPGSQDSYSCVVADEKTIVKILRGHGATADVSRLYALDGDRTGDFAFGVVNALNPAQKIARSKVAFGCIFNGTGKFTEGRTLTFTLKPVKVTQKSGAPIIVTRSQTRRLAESLR